MASQELARPCLILSRSSMLRPILSSQAEIHNSTSLHLAQTADVACCHSLSDSQIVPMWVQTTLRDAAPAYLASLPDTQQLLQARQRAWLARQRICAGNQPIAHHRLQASAMRTSEVQQQVKLCQVQCKAMRLSSCGNSMAVCIQGHPVFERVSKASLYHSYGDHNEVVVYTVPDFHVQACIQAHNSTPVVLWAPVAPHLSVAMLPPAWYYRTPAPALERPAAVVVDAPTGAVLCSLSLRT